jgi:beta-phosphoglucomutase family hydrolase
VIVEPLVAADRPGAALPGPILEAVVFDLDGVLTDTASLHQSAWQRLFDEVLRRYPSAAPFTEADYVRYVDGRRRIDGVAAVLASRGIELEPGDPDDLSDRETLAGLGRRKDDYYLMLLHDRGPRSFPSSVAVVRALRRQGVATAVVSGSRHCTEVLRAAGLTQLFDVQVDGIDAARLSLPGKPDPATFLEAARRLNVAPMRAAVVEDAIAGVDAGHRGGFALVVGVDRRGMPDGLSHAGAGIVIADLAEVTVQPAGPGRARLMAGPFPIPRAAAAVESTNEWIWAYEGFDPAREGVRETLCTLGNGYFATRGAAPEADQDDIHYPGTYVAGCYNRLVTRRGDEQMDNESLVNLPNWLGLRFQIGIGDWVEPAAAEVTTYWQELDMRHGLLRRQMRVTDSQGRRTLLTERRIVNMALPHLAAQEFMITAANWSGELRVCTGLDARVANLNVRADRSFSSKHLVGSVGGALDSDSVCMQVQTSQSHIHIAQASRVRATVDGIATGADRQLVDQPGFIGQELRLELREGQTATIEKVVSLYTSRDPAISDPAVAAAEEIGRAGSFAEQLPSHAAAWQRLWSRYDFDVGDAHADRVLRLHAFHVLQTLSRHTMELDVGIPARGLHGEGYRGHVFWDEVLVLPLLTYRLPELARELLGYRYRRLEAARRQAADLGYRGALFPWQSGSDGREETPTWIFNPRSQRWLPDNSRLQRHVNLVVAYNAWQYFEVTNDIEFLASYGAELLIEITRFFSSLAVFNAVRGRYEIRGVMGPDEYHDAYPGAVQPGIDNNAYTNVMVVWLMRHAAEALTVLHGYHCDELVAALAVEPAEIERWTDISARMFVPFHDGVISQFEGYERLIELDWNAYRARYPNIGRLDLILEAEGDTPNRYKLSKQADTLMLFYLLSAEELRELLVGMGYPLTPETILRTVDYYLARTSHGSTLSRVVDAWVLARSDRRRSWTAFSDALGADVADTQGGTTAEGIHLGAMAGTLDIVQRCYTGLEARDGVLWLNPKLPPELRFIELDLLYRGQWLSLHMTDRQLRIRAPACSAAPIRVGVAGQLVEVRSGETYAVDFPAGDLGGRDAAGSSVHAE